MASDYAHPVVPLIKSAHCSIGIDSVSAAWVGEIPEPCLPFGDFNSVFLDASMGRGDRSLKDFRIWQHPSPKL